MSRPSFASEVRAQLARLGELFERGRRERLNLARPDGREHPDPTPIELPIGYEHPPTLREQMQRYIREELSVQAAETGLGTFEEENDFEPEDPEEVQLSGYEVHEYEFVEEPASPLREDPEGTELGAQDGRTPTPAPDEKSGLEAAEAHQDGARTTETEPAPGSAGLQ